jgi:hypothetical protein
LVRFIIVTVGVMAIIVGGVYFGMPVKPTFYTETTIFLLLTTVIIFRYLYSQKNPQLFTQLYLATMAFKLLVYGGFVLTIVLIDTHGAVPNVIYFLCVYTVLTGLEVGFLYHRISGR